MTAHSDLTGAQDDVARTRAKVADTVAEIDARITDRVDAVKDRLNVAQIVRDHPWPALAAAVGVGVAVSASGADAKAASAAAERAKQAGSATMLAVREAPSHATSVIGSARGLVGRYADTLMATVALAVIDALRAPKRAD